ncbi:MAG: sulfatase family protein [Planctomycetota bacterium]|jgi:uncharacterized sulfatase
MKCYLVFVLLTGAASLAAAQPPNILLLIGDDMTWFDAEPYATPYTTRVRTPHMAKLAREGVCFDAMFTATAMCAPTRQQLYTGMFPVRNGAYPNHSKVHDGVRSLPHHLNALGYRVGLIGKTHFGPSESFPFENLGKKSTEYNKIRAFITSDPDQPFCLIVCANSPHKPWTQGDRAAYPPTSLTVPPNLIDTPETKVFLSEYYAEVTALDAELGRCMALLNREGLRDSTVTIFTSEQGMTLPFGGKWTCYDVGLKTAFIVRWPGVVAPNTRTAALTQYVDVVPTLVEIAGGDPSTINTGRPDAAGATGFDGRSLLNVLKGKTDTHHDVVFGVQTTKGIINGSVYPIRSARDARYKYIQNLNHTGEFNNAYTAGGKYNERYFAPLEKAAATDPAIAARLRHFTHRPAEELYDLQNDPYELNNLAASPEHQQIKARLRRDLQDFMAQQGDEGVQTELAGKRK